jgi:hypothetical protein
VQRESAQFPIYKLSTSLAQRPEALGTKEKFWITPTAVKSLPQEPHLFKIGRPNTGENWSERVCCELAILAGLPCAIYEFAEAADGTRGVLSRRFIDDTSTLIPGNMLLARLTPGYDGTQTYNQIQYTLGKVLAVLRRLHLQGTSFEGLMMKAIDLFVGYLVFDAWIGNTDRHHQNWGVIVAIEGPDDFAFRLAPTFDHASSLGRELSEDNRARRLSTNDRRDDVAAYATRARSAFFTDGPESKPLLMRDVLAQLKRSNQTMTNFWAGRICAISSRHVNDVFTRVNRSWISPQAAEFAVALLTENARVIREVCLDR